MNRTDLDALVATGSRRKIEKRLASLGYSSSKDNPEALHVPLVSILRQPLRMKTEWVRKGLTEVQMYATAFPVSGFDFVCLQVNRVQPLRGRSIPKEIKVYCKKA